MRPRRSGGGSRPFDWYMRTVVVAVPAWLASSSMVIWPSSFMRLIVFLRNDYYESIYYHSYRSNISVRTAMRVRHPLQRHPIPMACHFGHGLVVTWALPAQVLDPLIPPGLDLDTYD